MRQIKITENLIQLRRLIAFNCFFVVEEDGLTLVDTGLPGSAKGIVDAGRSVGRPIRRILLTHAHVDHAANVDAIVALLPEVEFIVPTRIADFIKGKKGLLPEEAQSPLKGGFQEVAATPTRLVEPGEMVGSLQVVAAPGHTPAHSAYLDLRDNTLIAGDALQTQGGTGVAGQIRPFFPLPAFATWHKPTALKTAQALLDLNPARLAVGHGPVIENPQAMMQTAIARG